MTEDMQAVSNTLWAYAKLSYNPGKLLMEVAAQKAMGMLHQYTSQELANTLWALATLEHYPGGAMLDAAAIQIARRIEQFSPQVRLKDTGEAPQFPVSSLTYLQCVLGLLRDMTCSLTEVKAMLCIEDCSTRS